MSKTSIKNSGHYLSNRLAFNAGSLRADWVTNPNKSEGRDPGTDFWLTVFDHTILGMGPVYVVYSYSTPIAAWLPDPGVWVFTTAKYSPTTSRHLNVIKQAVL